MPRRSKRTGGVARMARIFHIAFAVPDLEFAMLEIGAAMKVTWRTVYDFAGQLSDERGVEHDVRTRLTFSSLGPTVIELFEEVPGTPLASLDGGPFHHLGVWTDDFWLDSARLTDAGWPCRGKSPERTKPVRAGFFRGPSDITVELCSTRVDRPHLRDLYPGDSPFHGQAPGGLSEKPT
jgi:catechol 2,3-dioxygenase-like lactoylglutathione lyase family enzyme